MNEIKENNIINDNLIDDNNIKENSFKTFNILKEIQNLLKKESNTIEICKKNCFILLSYSY